MTTNPTDDGFIQSLLGLDPPSEPPQEISSELLTSDDDFILVEIDCDLCEEPIKFHHHGEENDLETLELVLVQHNQLLHGR